MLKIFTTQLMGKFKHIQDNHEMVIEDISRLLAQTITGGGKVYFKGQNELQGVALEAIDGADALPSCAILEPNTELTDRDTVLMFGKFNDDSSFAQLATEYKESGASVIGVAASRKNEAQALEDTVHFYINTGLTTGLVPDEDGERIGHPSLLVALFVYHAIYLTTKEILDEHGIEI
ncbi:DUF2529 family protein [Alkalihalobacillus sp. CinArs1]|uniref:DUF2529 family protein n=1 Tax=Alkalihalobacillus sp. CinArs1 TaxID=2995314 RepID=UPI0022DE542B|nr:DUF2529 family protein [Alkalihalobacillus sp. CinArs1]